MRRTFLIVFLMLLAVAAADFAIRAGSPSSLLSADFVPVLLSSSVSAALVASVVFLTGEAFWLVCMPIFAWCVVCTFGEGFFVAYFADKGICGEALMVELVTLSWEKVLAFFDAKMTPARWALATFMIMAVVGAVAWFVSARVPHPTRRSVYGGLLLIFALGCCLPLSVLDDHLSKAAFDHLFFHKSGGLFMYMDLQARGQPLPPGTYQTGEKDLLAVVIIGESSTRGHWSLYGYSRPTTPKLGALAKELVVFSNVTSTVGFTPYALRDLFTVADEGECGVSVPSAACSAGYDGLLVSGQARRGIYQGSGELLFRTCRERTYVDEVCPSPVFDDALVPLLRTALTAPASNCLVFVHTYGSHTPCTERYPVAFRRYSPHSTDTTVASLDPSVRKLVNEYDNSILFTDSVLFGLIAAVRETERAAVVVYVSDHGESPNTFYRDLESKETYEIPAFVWASPRYRRTHVPQLERLGGLAAQPLTSRDFFPILMDLLGLERR